jgi:translation initiation factor IF-2
MAKKKLTSNILARPPIVAILGHVDHGKTTLLDTIRKTHVTKTEAGGITQHIGAYQAEYLDNKITFIDTPGHAAFSKMRARGAQVTDLVILVIAATEGLKPQTVESIKHIKDAGVPLIIALNKSDLPGASSDMVKSQLTEHEIFAEGYGGQTPAVEISALKGTGIDHLLDMIILVAQVEEITSMPGSPLKAVIIESHLNKHRGPLATAIVKEGTLKRGDKIYLDETEIKVRALFNHLAQALDQALPGDPVEIMGFNQVPQVGSILTATPQAPQIIAPPPTPEETPPPTPEPAAEALDSDEVETEKTPPEEKAKKLTVNVIVKADTTGTLEAIVQNIASDELIVINQGIGAVTESDVLMAQATQASIIAFSVPVTETAKRLARIEKVRIKSFEIIYQLLEFLEEKVLELIEPTINEEVISEAKVAAVYHIKGDNIAGCKVKSGKLVRGDLAHVLRHGAIVKSGKIRSLKQGKEDIKEVTTGGECGVILQPMFDFQVDDMIQSYKIIEK